MAYYKLMQGIVGASDTLSIPPYLLRDSNRNLKIQYMGTRGFVWKPGLSMPASSTTFVIRAQSGAPPTITLSSGTSFGWLFLQGDGTAGGTGSDIPTSIYFKFNYTLGAGCQISTSDSLGGTYTDVYYVSSIAEEYVYTGGATEEFIDMPTDSSSSRMQDKLGNGGPALVPSITWTLEGHDDGTSTANTSISHLSKASCVIFRNNIPYDLIGMSYVEAAVSDFGNIANQYRPLPADQSETHLYFHSINDRTNNISFDEFTNDSSDQNPSIKYSRLIVPKFNSSSAIYSGMPNLYNEENETLFLQVKCQINDAAYEIQAYGYEPDDNDHDWNDMGWRNLADLADITGNTDVWFANTENNHDPFDVNDATRGLTWSVTSNIDPYINKSEGDSKNSWTVRRYGMGVQRTPATEITPDPTTFTRSISVAVSNGTVTPPLLLRNKTFSFDFLIGNTIGELTRLNPNDLSNPNTEQFYYYYPSTDTFSAPINGNSVDVTDSTKYDTDGKLYFAPRIWFHSFSDGSYTDITTIDMTSGSAIKFLRMNNTLYDENYSIENTNEIIKNPAIIFVQNGYEFVLSTNTSPGNRYCDSVILLSGELLYQIRYSLNGIDLYLDSNLIIDGWDLQNSIDGTSDLILGKLQKTTKKYDWEISKLPTDDIMVLYAKGAFQKDSESPTIRDSLFEILNSSNRESEYQASLISDNNQYYSIEQYTDTDYSNLLLESLIPATSNSNFYSSINFINGSISITGSPTISGSWNLELNEHDGSRNWLLTPPSGSDYYPAQYKSYRPDGNDIIFSNSGLTITLHGVFDFNSRISFSWDTLIGTPVLSTSIHYYINNPEDINNTEVYKTDFPYMFSQSITSQYINYLKRNLIDVPLTPTGFYAPRSQIHFSISDSAGEYHISSNYNNTPNGYIRFLNNFNKSIYLNDVAITSDIVLCPGSLTSKQYYIKVFNEEGSLENYTAGVWNLSNTLPSPLGDNTRLYLITQGVTQNSGSNTTLYYDNTSYDLNSNYPDNGILRVDDPYDTTSINLSFQENLTNGAMWPGVTSEIISDDFTSYAGKTESVSHKGLYKFIHNSSVWYTKPMYPSVIIGSHTGSNLSDVLTDTAKDFTGISLSGFVIYNHTDKSFATITTNTINTITSFTLSGGTTNKWNYGDSYTIKSNGSFDSDYSLYIDKINHMMLNYLIYNSIHCKCDVKSCNVSSIFSLSNKMCVYEDIFNSLPLSNMQYEIQNAPLKNSSQSWSTDYSWLTNDTYQKFMLATFGSSDNCDADASSKLLFSFIFPNFSNTASIVSECSGFDILYTSLQMINYTGYKSGLDVSKEFISEKILGGVLYKDACSIVKSNVYSDTSKQNCKELLNRIRTSEISNVFYNTIRYDLTTNLPTLIPLLDLYTTRIRIIVDPIWDEIGSNQRITLYDFIQAYVDYIEPSAPWKTAYGSILV